jgi:hypothetical protein
MSAPVQRLTATRFFRRMKTGRNGALLLGCEDLDGVPFEVVTKLRGREMNLKMQVSELIAGLFAPQVGIAAANTSPS